MATIRLERRYRFSASHLYRRPEWSEKKNRRHFGKCANLPGHGHNYTLYVTVSGTPDPRTGFVVDLGVLDELVQAAVLDRVDHRHLNEAVPEFGHGEKIPSSENVVLWILERLRGEMPKGAKLVGLRLDEDEDLAAVWTAGADRPG